MVIFHGKLLNNQMVQPYQADTPESSVNPLKQAPTEPGWASQVGALPVCLFPCSLAGKSPKSLWCAGKVTELLGDFPAILASGYD